MRGCLCEPWRFHHWQDSDDSYGSFVRAVRSYLAVPHLVTELIAGAATAQLCLRNRADLQTPFKSFFYVVITSGIMVSWKRMKGPVATVIPLPRNASKIDVKGGRLRHVDEASRIGKKHERAREKAVREARREVYLEDEHDQKESHTETHAIKIRLLSVHASTLHPC